MKKNIYVPIAAIVMIIYGLQSCSKEIDKTNTNAADSGKSAVYQVKNGRLVFNNAASLDSTMNILNTKSYSELDTWEKSIGFVSNRKYVHDIIMENWNNYIVKHDTLAPIIEYDDLPCIYKCILNQKGEVQVQDTVYYFRTNSVYAIPYTNESNIQSIEAQLDNSTKSVNLNVRKFSVILDSMKKSTNVAAQSVIANEEDASTSPMGMPGGDARYQSMWPSYGHTYKMVFRADVLLPLGGTIHGMSNLEVAVQNYLEYYHNTTFGGEWLDAGEKVYKHDEVSCDVLIYKAGAGYFTYSQHLTNQNYEDYALDNTHFMSVMKKSDFLLYYPAGQGYSIKGVIIYGDMYSSTQYPGASSFQNQNTMEYNIDNNGYGLWNNYYLNIAY